jgi:hypothetical protein
MVSLVPLKFETADQFIKSGVPFRDSEQVVFVMGGRGLRFIAVMLACLMTDRFKPC